MLSRRSLLLVTLALLSGCDGGNLVAVDLRTDYVPGAEFVRVRVELIPEEGRGRSVETPAILGDDFVAGRRVGELDDLPPGLTRLRIDLLDVAGAALAERAVVADVRGSLGVTIAITRDCADVTCPAPGGDPALEACLGGRCVDPSCTEETASACGAPECTLDSECPAPAGACARARCVAGTCLETLGTPCASDEYCSPELGCTALPVVGGPDASIDATMDAGVDASADADGGGDGGLPPAVVSITRLTTVTEFSYVALEVDWTRRLAYLGSRASGVCLEVVDFTDEEAPRVIAEYDRAGTPAMPGNTCLGLALLDERYLFVGADDGTEVRSYDLGADPRALGYTMIDSVDAPRVRSIAIEPGDGAIVVGYGVGARRVLLDAGRGFVSTQDLPVGCALDAVASFSPTHALGGCAPDGEPIRLLHFATGDRSTVFDMDNGGVSGFWRGAASADGSKAFVGGWVAAFFATDPVVGTARRTLRYEVERNYRDAVFVENGVTQLWAPLANDNRLEVWDVSDIEAPTLTHDLAVPLPDRELYAIEVDTSSRRALLVSNDGWLVIVDIDLMPTTTRTPTTF